MGKHGQHDSQVSENLLDQSQSKVRYDSCLPRITQKLDEDAMLSLYSSAAFRDRLKSWRNLRVAVAVAVA